MITSMRRRFAGLILVLCMTLCAGVHQQALAGSLSDFAENAIVDGYMRGGALGSGGAVNSIAVVKGVWTASTAYVVGDIVVPHANMTGAGGKFLRCTTAGTSGSTNTLAVPAVGSTLTDSGVTWTAVSGLPALLTGYVGLLTATPSDTGGGTEVSGGSYARVAVSMTMTNWAGTQSATSTTYSSGTGGTTSNNGAITFPAPTANWGTVTHFALYDQASGGNLIYWAALTTSKTVNNGDAAPSFAISALTFQIDTFNYQQNMAPLYMVHAVFRGRELIAANDFESKVAA